MRSQCIDFRGQNGQLANTKAPIFVSWTIYHKQFETAVAAEGDPSDTGKGTALILILPADALEILHTILWLQMFHILCEDFEFYSKSEFYFGQYCFI